MVKIRPGDKFLAFLVVDMAKQKENPSFFGCNHLWEGYHIGYVSPILVGFKNPQKSMIAVLYFRGYIYIYMPTRCAP